MFEVIAIAAVLAAISYLSEHVVKITTSVHNHLVSFSAGILVAVIFMKFLPMLHAGVSMFGSVLYIAVLLGFMGYNIAEEWLYQHSGPAIRRKELGAWHGIGFFIDHFILGFALVVLWLLGAQTIALALAIPFALYVATSAHSVLWIRRELRFSASDEILLASAPLIGALVGWVLAQFLPVVLYALFAYIAGSLLYLVARDLIPKEREARPAWFVLGAVLTAAILLVF